MANEKQTLYNEPYITDVRDEMVNHTELVLRAQNDEHWTLLFIADMARWLQENPYDGASDAALEWARQYRSKANIELDDFQRNGYKYPDTPEGP